MRLRLQHSARLQHSGQTFLIWIRQRTILLPGNLLRHAHLAVDIARIPNGMSFNVSLTLVPKASPTYPLSNIFGVHVFRRLRWPYIPSSYTPTNRHVPGNWTWALWLFSRNFNLFSCLIVQIFDNSSFTGFRVILFFVMYFDWCITQNEESPSVK